ncbi:MAG: pentapeptide repeat-containing protein [Chloroflexota bacterium]
MIERRSFDNCTFNHCSFQETTFQNCKFRECTFLESDLRLVHVTGSSFRETVFKNSAVVGVNWVEGSWSKTGLLESIGFVECEVSHSIFMGLELKKLVLTKCVAKDADFAEANLTQADFTHTDFAGSRFSHTNLTEADFTNARNYAIDIAINTVKKARFSLPEAVNLLRLMNIVLVDDLPNV